MKRDLFIGMVKDWLLALAIVIGVMVAWNTFLPSSHLPAGELAPTFSLQGPSGEQLDLQTLRGQRVVLNFWATWCPPCRAEIPDFASFHADHPDVPLYGISIDEAVSGRGLAVRAKALGITYPVLHDPLSDVAHAYAVHAVPTTVIIDEEGRVAAVHEGPLNRDRLERLFATISKTSGS